MGNEVYENDDLLELIDDITKDDIKEEIQIDNMEDKYNVKVNSLFDNNKKLVYHIVNKNIPYSSNLYEDSIQAGMIALWKASISYDKSKGIKFSTFACRAIYNEVSNLFHKYYGRKNSWKRKYESNKFYLDADTNEENPDSDWYDLIAYNKDNFAEDNLTSLYDNINDLMDDFLTERDREIIIKISLGKSQYDLSKEMGISQSYISRRYNRLCNRLVIMNNLDKKTVKRMHDITDNLINIYSANNGMQIINKISKKLSEMFDIDLNVCKMYVTRWLDEYRHCQY